MRSAAVGCLMVGVSACAANAPTDLDSQAATEGATLEMVGHAAALAAQGSSDVWVHQHAIGKFAYMGGFTGSCEANDDGHADLHIFDVSDQGPFGEVATIAAQPNTRINDIKVLSLDSPTFRGDVLIHSNENCHVAGEESAVGFEIYDVTNPRSPKHLSHVEPGIWNAALAASEVGDVLDRGVHNTFPFRQGERSFVAACVFDAFAAFRIYEITNPTAPTLVGSWGIEELLRAEDPDTFAAVDFRTMGQGSDKSEEQLEAEQGLLMEVVMGYLFNGFGAMKIRYLHDVTVDATGETAYLAFWDGGLITLDIRDAAAPTLLAVAIDSDNSDGEVNSHSSWPSADGSVVVEGNEDFSALGYQRLFAPWFGQMPGPEGTDPVLSIVGAGLSTAVGDVVEGALAGPGRVRLSAKPFEVFIAEEHVDPSSSAYKHHVEEEVSANLTVAFLTGALAGHTFEAVEASGSQPHLAPMAADGDGHGSESSDHDHSSDLVPGNTVEAEAVWLGLACDEATTINGPEAAGAIAFVRRGDCPFDVKYQLAQSLGAVAVVVVNNEEDTAWGGLRIWDYSDPAAPHLLSNFDTVCSADPDAAGCDEDAWYSAHNIIVEGDYAYVSWYSDGVLVIDISDPSNPVEVARWNPRDQGFEDSNGGVQSVWGVHKLPGDPHLYVSDMNGGLYVLRVRLPAPPLDEDEPAVWIPTPVEPLTPRPVCDGAWGGQCMAWQGPGDSGSRAYYAYCNGEYYAASFFADPYCGSQW